MSVSQQSMDEGDLSPKSRLKFLCSSGGRILPRPGDGGLRYVGGETRVVVVPRSITFSDLHAKIAATFGGTHSAADDLVIKYQIAPEDLDALVSVRSDEDLLHMIEEYDRHHHSSPTASPRFRLFLFYPSHPSSGAATPRSVKHDPHPIFAFSASPGNSPPGSLHDAQGVISAAAGVVAARSSGGLQRVRSTPNLGEMAAGSGATTPGSPRYMLRHPPLHKYTAAFGGNRHPHHHHHYPHGPHPLFGNAGVGHHPMVAGNAGPHQRFEFCGCGCGLPVAVPVAPHPQQRRYYYPGPTPGYAWGGHVDEPGGMRSVPSHHHFNNGMPPRSRNLD